MDRQYDERYEDRRVERPPERHRGGVGRFLLIVVLLAAVVVAILFATGFWRADMRQGSLPDINVSVKGGELPKIDVDSKKVVVGTKQETVEVPTVGVKDSRED